jgi:hypothetical protein
MAIALRGTPTDAQNATGSSVSLSVPSGVQNGDFMLLMIVGYGTGGLAGVPQTPSGWTLVGLAPSGATGNNVNAGLYQRVANNEPASYTISVLGGDAFINGDMTAWSGVNTSTPFNLAETSANGQSTTPTSANLGNTTVDNCWHILHFAAYDSLSGAITGYTQDLNGTSGFEWHKLITPAGATGAKSMTNSAASGWAVWTGALNPSGAAAVAIPLQVQRRRPIAARVVLRGTKGPLPAAQTAPLQVQRRRPAILARARTAQPRAPVPAPAAPVNPAFVPAPRRRLLGLLARRVSAPRSPLPVMEPLPRPSPARRLLLAVRTRRAPVPPAPDMLPRLAASRPRLPIRARILTRLAVPMLAEPPWRPPARRPALLSAARRRWLFPWPQAAAAAPPAWLPPVFRRLYRPLWTRRSVQAAPPWGQAVAAVTVATPPIGTDERQHLNWYRWCCRAVARWLLEIEDDQ